MDLRRADRSRCDDSYRYRARRRDAFSLPRARLQRVGRFRAVGRRVDIHNVFVASPNELCRARVRLCAGDPHLEQRRLHRQFCHRA